MSDKEWRNENDIKVDYIINEITNGDKNASAYLYDLSAAARIVDDIYDEFENVDPSHAMLMVEILFVRIPNNPFSKRTERNWKPTISPCGKHGKPVTL